jgi:hypothetical protein
VKLMLRVVVVVEVIEAGKSRDSHTQIKLAKTLKRLASHFLNGKGYHYTRGSLETAAK